MTGPDELKAVDGLSLSAEHRAALRPGGAVTAEDGTLHHLPRFFFEVPSWEEAHSLRIAARVNGETLQDSNTDQLVFSIPRLLAV